jgi:hypothetical protein
VLVTQLNSGTDAVGNHAQELARKAQRISLVSKMPFGRLLISVGAILAFVILLIAFWNQSNKGVTCDTFEIVADLRGDTLSLRLETDLPDAADIMISVSRLWFDKNNPDKIYVRDYFSQKSKVANWRTGNTCSVADQVFEKSLQEQIDMMASVGIPVEVASVADEIEVSFVLPINQSSPAFGERNSNLNGSLVPVAELKAIRAEKTIQRPLGKKSSEMPKPRTASHNTLEIGLSYRLSHETPLMPEIEPMDPLDAITRKISIPASSKISIQAEKKNTRGTWYRAEAYGLDGRRIGEGWINSVALMGQNITRTE